MSRRGKPRDTLARAKADDRDLLEQLCARFRQGSLAPGAFSGTFALDGLRATLSVTIETVVDDAAEHRLAALARLAEVADRGGAPHCECYTHKRSAYEGGHRCRSAPTFVQVRRATNGYSHVFVCSTHRENGLASTLAIVALPAGEIQTLRQLAAVRADQMAAARNLLVREPVHLFCRQPTDPTRLCGEPTAAYRVLNHGLTRRYRSEGWRFEFTCKAHRPAGHVFELDQWTLDSIREDIEYKQAMIPRRDL